MPYVWFLLICSIWGSSFILMKRASVCLSPTAISGGRVVFGALVLAIILLRLRQPRILARRDFWPLLGVIITGFAWPYTIQPWLIGKHQNSAFIGLTVAFTPLLTIGLSAVMFGTRPTVRQIVGVCGALVCLLLLMWDGWQQSLSGLELLLALSVPFTYATANLWIRRYLTHVPSVQLTVACLTGAAMILLPAALVSPAPATASADAMWLSWGALAILGILGTGIATWLFNHLVIEQGPLFAAMVTNLAPLGAVAWGLADGETVTLRQILALLGVLSMVALVQYKAAAPPKVEPTQPRSAEA